VKARYAGVPVTATEPVFGDMAEAMGLKMLNVPFQFAIMNETEPSPTDVAGFENSLRSGTAKILFYNSQVTDDTTTRLLDLAKAGDVPVIGVTETEPAGQTIESWFSGQIAAVQSSLASHH
jgi:zinc/manganese transport system substrate-binding protein